jgi:sulfite oxidase
VGKHPDFIIREAEPFNGGAPLLQLIAAFLTPNDQFFVRSHAPVPGIDPDTYLLRIGGLVAQPAEWTLADLRAHFERVEVVATLQCAGNRRQQLAAIAPVPDELMWDNDAISTARWSGFRLRNVLLKAGVQEEAAHIAFVGLDEIEKRGETFGLGGSIPLDKALSPEVLLVDTMNDAPLPPEHGFPLRVVVPGYIGARSVKWLGEINAQPHPSDNYYQARAYKLFPPGVDEHTVDWATGLMLGEMPITSVIADPADGAPLPAGTPMTVRGFAYTGAGRGIARVDVSGDGGATWVSADLLPTPDSTPLPWAWQFWQARLNLPAGEHELVARAFDTAANTQPEAPIWNFKGYMNNAWHRVRVQVR